LNPCLSEFSRQTQEYLVDGDPGYEIRQWIDRFVHVKQNKLLIGMNAVLGDASTFWMRCFNPQRLPSFLSLLPNPNYVSVLYGNQYSYPDMRLSVVDIIALTLLNMINVFKYLKQQ